MNLGPYAGFILSSYAAFALALAALIAWLQFDGARLQRQLDALEARGVRRRSAGSGPDDRPV
jgi:heme exporter protein D